MLTHNFYKPIPYIIATLKIATLIPWQKANTESSTANKHMRKWNAGKDSENPKFNSIVQPPYVVSKGKNDLLHHVLPCVM